MSALTRILNNQIYNSTIVGYQKIAAGTITGSLFASNVTVPGDLLISGNLFVLGSSSYTTIASTNTYVNDPLVVLNNGFAGTNTYDEGLIFNRGTSQNQAIIWSETFGEFRLIATNEAGTTYGNINASGLARLSIGSLNVPGQANIGVLSVSGAITGASVNVSGNVLAAAGVYNQLTVNGNELVTGYLNVTGNILASQGRLNYLDVNGNVDLGLSGAVSGSWVNVIGNITQTSSGGAVYFNTAGNVLATAGTFNALTVNGNESVTGYLNVTGNVMGAAATFSSVLSNGVINTTGNVLATAGVFNALTVNGDETVTGYLNVTGNVLTASLSAGQINTTGNVLATAGVFNALTVNGNESITGYLNVTGNVMASQGLLNYLDVNGNVDLGLAGAVSGSWVNVIGNITQTSSGGAVYFNTTGNISAAAGVFGAITSTGYINTSGNISTAQLNAGQINTTGNVLATAGVFNALTVNGNETVTGYLNVAGNIIATTADVGSVEASGVIYANSSAATTTQGTGALIVPTGGISVAGAANIAGATTVGGAVQLNNTLSVGGIEYITNTTNATEATGSSGALQIKGGASIAKDLYIGGNIYAANIYSTSYQVITVKDPLLYLDAANTFPYNYDIGFYSNFVGPNPIDNTGNVYQHSGVVRDNVDNTWKFFSNVRTEPSGSEITFDVNTIYDPVKAGNLVLTYTQAATSTGTGALQVAGGAGIAGTLVAGQLNSTGNVLGQSGTFNALTVNGNETVTGYINAVGNISTPLLNAGQINTTGNVLAATVGASFVTASTATVGNISAVTIGNSGATVTGTSGIFGAVTSGFIGNTGTAYTGASINLSGNVLASTVLASLVTAGDATFGNVDAGFIGNTGTTYTGASINLSANVLAAAGVFNGLTVNGNESVTGYLNVTGNILADTSTFRALTVNGNIATTGQIVTTRAGSATTGNGQIYLNGSTSNRIDWNANGFGPPVFTTRTTGTKVVLYPALSGSSVDYAIGIDAATMWSSVPENGDSFNFRWYGAETLVANLSGTGNFTTAGAIVVNSTTPASTSATGALIVKGGAGIAGNLYVGAGIQNTDIGNTTAATGSFTTLRASAGIWANSTTASTSTTTGAIVVAGGIGLAGNIRAGGGAVINNSQTADPFQVKGVATTSLIYADTAQGAVIVGGSNTAPQLGSTLKINGSDSLLLPIGSTGQRPGATGNVDIAGMIRFNTTIQNMEFYDGTIWQTAGSVFTVISDRQFAGNVAGGYGNVDGTNTNFTIQSSSTTSATIVSINGVLQFPVLAYDVSGTTLTFTEPPAPTDVIDVRVLATTSTIGALANGNGLNQVIADNDGVQIWTGTSSTTERILVNQVGDVNLLDNNKITYTQTAVNIAANNTPYVIATYSQTAYTTAKFLVSAKKGATNFQSMESMVTTDGAGNAYMTTYAVVNNGTDMGGLTANVVGGNVNVYWTTTTNVINANVKALGTYIV